MVSVSSKVSPPVVVKPGDTKQLSLDVDISSRCCGGVDWCVLAVSGSICWQLGDVGRSVHWQVVM
jgi:hypothetical protein